MYVERDGDQVDNLHNRMETFQATLNDLEAPVKLPLGLTLVHSDDYEQMLDQEMTKNEARYFIPEYLFNFNGEACIPS